MNRTHRARLFGTDGIRAPFGEPPLDEATVREVSYHAARSAARGDVPPRAFVAGDTRDSTEVLQGWISEGIEAAGGFVTHGGVLPTPGVAHVVREGRYDLGIAISASHNPWPDNGLKLFDREGYKWSVDAERALERQVGGALDRFVGTGDSVDMSSEAARLYVEALRATLGGDEPLSGVRLVVDCAHGATAPFAGDLLRQLGAEIDLFGDAPDGRNINQGCGSTHPEEMASRTGASEADLGVAFDGDGDRVVFADETGALRDGDALLYLWARALRAAGELPGNRIVATTMSNIGLERALARHDVAVERCDVGDRVVVETMRRLGARLGGEQSGHIIDLTRASTGDGLLTAIHLGHHVCMEQRDSGRTLSELLARFERYPQVLKNVRVATKPPFEELPTVTAHAAAIEERLAQEGRLVLRYSGTEPLARVMIEGQDQSEIDALALELCETIENAIGASATA